LAPYNSFGDLTDDPVLRKDLKQVYGHIGALDLFMGGLAEPHASGAVVGATFQSIIANQFQALRAGDRFFWQNQNFNQGLASAIASTRLADIIKRNTNTTLILQPNVFIQQTPGIHVKHHVDPPNPLDTHGRKPAFTD
jgi:peroxidase